MKKNPLLPWLIAALVIFGAPMAYWAYYMSTPGKYDTFATCITDSGAKFYGTFWCPHCGAQKAMFGKSKEMLPYIECSTPDRNGQLQVCKDAGITSYPTWEFADGSRASGEQQLTTLAEKTSCSLPE